ncbi:ewing's tumor-associated antigen 1 isoform X2 [Tachysurus ichikawai]
MTDTNKTNNTRSTVDATKEIRSRIESSENKFKTNSKYLREQKLSPSLSTSLYCGRDVGTPKHRSRRIFNCCPNGDSPSEADAMQDIIWDPASPPQMRTGE